MIVYASIHCVLVSIDIYFCIYIYAGEIMDIHDGNTFKLGDTYYYYGASYGMCQEPAGDSGCAGTQQGSCVSTDKTHYSTFLNYFYYLY